MKITIEDFAPLSTLVRAYELQPGKHYLIVCDGKSFDFALASNLFKRVAEWHPEAVVAVVNTLAPKSVTVVETTLADEMANARPELLTDDCGCSECLAKHQSLAQLLDRAVAALRGQHGSV